MASDGNGQFRLDIRVRCFVLEAISEPKVGGVSACCSVSRRADASGHFLQVQTFYDLDQEQSGITWSARALP